MAGIYIHIPFCKQACYYCNFHFSTSIKNKDAMINAISKELILRKNEIKEEVETIYFGGGTPSLLSNFELQFLLNVIYKNYNISINPEITLEANPDDLSMSRIKQLAQTPINRLSIGIQSFFEDDLKAMNRAHTANESIECLSAAIRSFENISIDLIYGISNMSESKWKQNLQMTFDFGIPHISSYALTVEPKTALDSFIKSGKYPPLDEDLAARHFDILVEKTQNNNFVQYEISSFGKQNFFSKHNTSYWLGKPYLGIGPSAHSYDGVERSWNISNNTKYITSITDNSLPSESENLSKKDKFNEYIMTGLRTIWGVDLKKILSEFGEVYESHLLDSITVFINQELLNVENSVIRTTSKGKFLVDGIASELFMI